MPAAGGQSGGQDNQQFCYDDLDRLTWAGTSGTNPCTSQSITGSTLTNADYTASYTYDVSNRFTQSTLTGALSGAPQGSYTYDSTHYHAVDVIASTSYEAQYDVSGNMTCRTATNSSTCTSSSQTGAALTYDVEGRLIEWDSADGATKVEFGYTGEGGRFIQQLVTNGQTTSTTLYLGSYEVLAVPGQQAVVTTYFTYNGKIIAENQGGHWYFLLDDGLGSVNVVVDATGVIAAQLFAPYGQLCWSGGTMPTSYAFTGQRADTSTGLDYYIALYYDPGAGQFISADSDSKGGLNRYAYVKGNPETMTDPSGHRACAEGYTCDAGPPSLPPPPDPVQQCVGSAQICQQIYTTFHDKRTWLALFMMLRSSKGAEFVKYLLAEGQKWRYSSTCRYCRPTQWGDNFIQWGDANGGDGYTDSDGHIILNADMFKNGETEDAAINAAFSLTHEAVESYYAIGQGMRWTASRHMDYVADWFAGQVRSEIGDNLDTYLSDEPRSSYQESFASWDARYGQEKFKNESENQNDASGILHAFDGFFFGDSNTPNPMGLTTDMLTSSCLGKCPGN